MIVMSSHWVHVLALLHTALVAILYSMHIHQSVGMTELTTMQSVRFRGTAQNVTGAAQLSYYIVVQV